MYNVLDGLLYLSPIREEKSVQRVRAVFSRFEV